MILLNCLSLLGTLPIKTFFRQKILILCSRSSPLGKILIAPVLAHVNNTVGMRSGIRRNLLVGSTNSLIAQTLKFIVWICCTPPKVPKGETASWGHYFNDFIGFLLLLQTIINNLIYTNNN